MLAQFFSQDIGLYDKVQSLSGMRGFLQGQWFHLCCKKPGVYTIGKPSVAHWSQEAVYLLLYG